MKLLRARFEWKLSDMWIGVFWKPGHVTTHAGPVRIWTDVWICVIPCVPFHMTILHDGNLPAD
jgi:hypothetical protein